MTSSIFDLSGKVVVITGAAGLLGSNHAFAVAEAGGIPVVVDIDKHRLDRLNCQLTNLGARFLSKRADVTKQEEVDAVADLAMRTYGSVWGLVNNVAANPPMSRGGTPSTLESTSIDSWNHDLALGLTAAWLCGRTFGSLMASQGAGSIVNVASDLAIIAPDQRIYREIGRDDSEAPRKPASYSASKGGLRMLSKFFATYWAPLPVRSNCLMPGSVLSTQGSILKKELEGRIPLGRLASAEEYKGAIVFLLSEASSYMTGADLIMDGGRSAW